MLRQAVPELIPAMIIAKKIVPALFAFEYGNRGNGRFAVDSDPGDIDPER
jgi:hypothetical protein